MGTLGRSMTREEATTITKMMINELYKIHTDYDIDNIIVAGSIRRNKIDNIGDIDIILVTLSGELDLKLANYLADNFNFRIHASGSKLLRGLLQGIQFDFYACSEDQVPYMLTYLTGPQDFNIGMRARARKLGYKLNQLGIMKSTGELVTGIHNEDQLFYLLGCKYIEPECRTNWYKNYKEYKL